MSRRFTTCWITQREAARFITRHHRHHVPPVGSIVCIGLWEGGTLVGVGVLGRAVSRALQARGVCEITRLCVAPDVRHAASALAGRMRLVAQALGFTRCVTYTLAEEGGASLRAVGFQADMALAGGGEWSVRSRPRAAANYPVTRKVRWWAPLRLQRDFDL